MCSETPRSVRRGLLDFNFARKTMPNIGQVLRDEIARISRRESRKQSSVLQRASAAYRRDIAALKREIATLRREVKKKPSSKSAAVEASAETKGKLRFRADGFRTMRRRLGLSASQLGKLLGVSEQSIYNWETKTATPRSSHLPTIARLRTMGKREVQQLLERA
jgi:DNA-binding transcriptional regulator YiaG